VTRGLLRPSPRTRRRGGTAHAGNSQQLVTAPSDSYSRTIGNYSYRMVVQYDGTAYRGWQIQQSGFPSIQGAIEHALWTRLREHREKLKIGAAGRTDRGVHAHAQVVQFYSDHEDLGEADTLYGINRLLPRDVRVLKLMRTAPDFNVTISATNKTYHYYIDTNMEHDVFMHRFRMHHRLPLDVARMREGAALLRGKHNFTQLSNRSDGERKRNPVKTMYHVDVVELPNGLLRLEFCGSGFLYKMVRHMTGALIAIGQCKLPPEWISGQLEIGDTVKTGAGGHHRGYKVAPAQGLVLHAVEYIPGIDDPNTLLYPDEPHDEWGRLLDFAPGLGHSYSGGEE